MSHPALITYPAQAAFGRTLPKSKIYEHSHASARLKDLFVKQVEQITWQYKLAPETIKLAARPAVPEIQVFSLQLKVTELHRDVLRCIDEVVQFPVIFELAFQGRTQVIAAYKRQNGADSSRWVLSDYFATDWLPSGSQRVSLPVALHLGGLYEHILSALIPLAARPQESLASLVERTSKVQTIRRVLERTVSQLEKEKQFNRKVEVNAKVRELKSDLSRLGGDK